MDIDPMKSWAVWLQEWASAARYEAVDVTRLDVTNDALPRPPGNGWSLLTIIEAPTARKAIADAKALNDAGLLNTKIACCEDAAA